MDRDNILRDCICDQRNCGGGGGGEPDRLATRDCRHAQTRRRCNQQHLHQDATDERHDLSSSNNMNRSSRAGSRRRRKSEEETRPTDHRETLKHHVWFCPPQWTPISRPRPPCFMRRPMPAPAKALTPAHSHDARVCAPSMFVSCCATDLCDAFCLSLSLLRASVSPRLVHAQHGSPTLWLLGDFRLCCLPGPRPRQEDECTARLWPWPRRLI